MSLISSKISESLEELKKDNPDYDIYAEFVGRYGFENAAEIYDFLKSEIGREALGEIEKKLAEEIERIEHIKSNNIEEVNLRLEKLCLRLLKLIYRNEARDKLLEEGLKQYKENILEHNKHKSTSSEPHDFYDASLSYDSSLKLMESNLNNRLKNGRFEAMVDNLNKKYAIEIEAIDHIHKLLSKIEPSDRAQAIKDLLDKISDEKNEHPEKNEILNLQEIALQQQLAVLAKEKIMFTADGLPTDDINNAEFIVGRDKKIVNDGKGNFYLIDSTKELDQLSEDEQKKAMKALEKTEYMSAKGMVNSNRDKQEIKLAEPYLDDIKEILERANQITLMQAAQAKAGVQAQAIAQELVQAQSQAAETGDQMQMQTQAPTAKMSPLPSVSKISAKSAPRPMSAARVAILRNGLDKKPLSNQDIRNIKRELSDAPESVQKESNKLRLGRCIPPAMMIRLSKSGWIHTPNPQLEAQPLPEPQNSDKKDEKNEPSSLSVTPRPSPYN